MTQKRNNKPLVPIHLQKFPLCGAKSKRTGKPCQAPAMTNGRCRMHGGLSTGPRTDKGKARVRQNAYKHGFYSKEEKQLRREAQLLLKTGCKTIEELQKKIKEKLKQQGLL